MGWRIQICLLFSIWTLVFHIFYGTLTYSRSCSRLIYVRVLLQDCREKQYCNYWRREKKKVIDNNAANPLVNILLIHTFSKPVQTYASSYRFNCHKKNLFYEALKWKRINVLNKDVDINEIRRKKNKNCFEKEKSYEIVLDQYNIGQANGK